MKNALTRAGRGRGQLLTEAVTQLLEPVQLIIRNLHPSPLQRPKTRQMR